MVGSDVVVVGAGIMGAACAARLGERGLRVTVLEQAASPALGSSGRSAAGVRTQFHTDTNILLSMHSIAEYRTMPGLTWRPAGPGEPSLGGQATATGSAAAAPWR